MSRIRSVARRWRASYACPIGSCASSGGTISRPWMRTTACCEMPSAPMLESRAPHVSVDGFEGPLDLLLELIEEQRLDILTVRLGDLAETYLARVRAMAELPAEEVAAFLVLAARLVLIKARSILPQASPEELESAETDEAELRQRLLEYQAVRER